MQGANGNKKMNKARKAKARKDAMDLGAYDGRYREKVIPDKKKEAKKKGEGTGDNLTD